MRKTFLLFFTIHISLLTFSQSWEPVGGGLTGEDTNLKEVVYTMCVYNNKLYVGGRFTKAGKLKVNYIARWDGTKWDSVGSGTNGDVEALCVYKHWLALSGDFTIAGRKHTNRIALCADTATDDKTTWFNLGKGILKFREGSFHPSVSSLIEYGGFLYTRGYFTDVGDITSNGIAKWNGNTGWQYLAKVDVDPEDAGPLSIFNNKLYIGGDTRAPLYQLEGKNMLWSWDDNAFTSETIANGPACIESILVTDSSIYVAGPAGKGQFLPFKPTDKKQYSVCVWDKKNWRVLGDSLKWGHVHAMVVFKGKLFIGGQCTDDNGNVTDCVACWDGNSWQPVGACFSTPVKWHRAHVQSLCVYKGELYAAGYFTNAGGKTVMNIAKLNPKKK